jgi:hypothetical protein
MDASDSDDPEVAEEARTLLAELDGCHGIARAVRTSSWSGGYGPRRKVSGLSVPGLIRHGFRT